MITRAIWPDGDVERPALFWVAGPGWRMASSAVLGGGIGPRAWWLNATVHREYHHRDPAAHAQGVAAGLGLSGAGVAMLTAADVRRVRLVEEGGVRVAATVGLGVPTWAAVPDGTTDPQVRVGTINLLVIVPQRLSDAALVNAVVTATEAKAQALAEAGIPGTGTASDAVCIACPDAGGTVDPYAGPRSRWGARLARAVHRAVGDGTAGWLVGDR
jgi:adenosylcobinamide amidohydrolase